MLEIRIRLCSRAHALIQWVALRGDGGTPAASEVWDKPAVPQAALVVLRLRGASAIVASLNACGLGIGGAGISRQAVDAEEVLDLLAGGVVDFGVGAQCLAREAALLLAGVRHAGVVGGREARHGQRSAGSVGIVVYGVVLLSNARRRRRDSRGRSSWLRAAAWAVLSDQSRGLCMAERASARKFGVGLAAQSVDVIASQTHFPRARQRKPGGMRCSGGEGGDGVAGGGEGGGK